MDILDAISPIDGRYRGKTEPLAAYFSESALIRYRVKVEIEYYIALMQQLGCVDQPMTPTPCAAFTATGSCSRQHASRR